MSSTKGDVIFMGSIPKLYESYLVPMIFEPYAADLASRISGRPLSRVLEIAAGTGVVTRELARILPTSVAIVATDLNEPMLEQAREIGTSRPVEWRQADAMNLPFPDKAKAFSEAHRVLRRGGIFVFNVWDRIEENQFVDTVTTALEKLFPDDPPRFHARVPHGYYSRSIIEQDLAAGGFTVRHDFTTLTARSQARSPRIPAMGYCQGTPLRNEIEERDASLLGDATLLALDAISERFGTTNISGKLQAHIVTVEK